MPTWLDKRLPHLNIEPPEEMPADPDEDRELVAR